MIEDQEKQCRVNAEKIYKKVKETKVSCQIETEDEDIKLMQVAYEIFVDF